MSKGTFWRPLALLLGMVALAVGIAACGGGSSSSTAEEASTTAEESKAGGEAGGSGEGAAEAKAAIEPFIGQPSPFPVTEKLKEVPKGKTIAFMDRGNTYSALMYELMEPAAQMLGMKLERIKAGSAANTISAAFDSVVANHPDAVVIPSIEPELYSKQLKELQEEEVAVITTGVVKAEEYGIESPQYAGPAFEQVAQLQADYVTAEFGADSNVVYYGIPELAFTELSEAAFAAELEKVCPDCQVHFTSIPVATVGTTAPNAIVSDLQANPETEVAVFEAGELEAGLPAALKAAGITVKTLSGAPVPSNYQALKEGTETAALASDLPVLAWTLVDQAAREITGQELSGPEAEGFSVIQFLTKKDITFDTSKGWTGYPEFAETFAKLWGVGG